MTTPQPSRSKLRRAAGVVVTLVLVAIALLAVSRSAPVLRHPLLLVALAREGASPSLPVPVQGVKPRDLRDSWGAARSEGRKHQGIDIFAKRGTRILSATRGIAWKVGTNRLGGRIVTVVGPGLEVHYYAHLDAYGNFHPGDRVNPGDVLGFVGDTGNARGTPPHLHYGIYHASGAVNPYPRLAATE